MSSYGQRALVRIGNTGTLEHDFKGIDIPPISYLSGGSWVVCYTEARAEGKAAKDMRLAGIEPFVPMERFRGKPGKPVVERALFPRYVFARVDLDRDGWGALLGFDGVMDVLRNCNTPMRMADAHVDALRKAEAVGLFDHTTINPNGFAVGEQVRVAEGPFAGLNAEIREFVGKIRSATAVKRARVLVNFMGRLTGMEMPVTALEKV